MNKICSKCGIEKDVGEFYKYKNYKDGLSYWCKKCFCKQVKQYRKNNTDKVKQWNKQYKLKNPEKVKQAIKQWRKENPDHNNKHRKQRYKTDINYKIRYLCRGMVNHALKGNLKSEHTMTYFMCTVAEFKKHIEKQWQPWMNWKNHGIGPGTWQVDHMIPVSFFKPKDEVEKYMCCRWQNLQPLSWEENELKRDKLE